MFHAEKQGDVGHNNIVQKRRWGKWRIKKPTSHLKWVLCENICEIPIYWYNIRIHNASAKIICILDNFLISHESFYSFKPVNVGRLEGATNIATIQVI